MHSYVIARAASLADDIARAHGARSLEDGVEAFVEVLQCLPDYPAAAFPAASMHRVRAQAEEVIASVERWVDANPDSRHNQRLVGSVYGIRRAIEEMNRWQQHYMGATTNKSAAL